MTAEGTFPKSNGDVLYASEANTFFTIVPIGTILPWAKTITGVPTLPSNFVECNGAVLSDAASPLDGQTMPDLNTTKRFLRGSSTSGTTGGSDTHTHTGTTDNNSNQQNYVSSGSTSAATHNHTFTTGSSSTLPAYYEVVYIIRVK